MTTTINNLPLDEIRLILEWVNEPKNAVVCKSWKVATEQYVAMLMNGDQGYFHSKILHPFLPSSAPPNTHPKQMRFMAEVIKNVRAYCNLTPNTAPLILSAHKPIKTAVLEEIVTRVSTKRSEQGLITFMNEVNEELPPDQQFRPSSSGLTNAQKRDEIRLFFQNPQPAIQRITSLDLELCTLFSLPPEIGQFVNLQDLYADNHNITSLPPEIKQLSHLQTLYVSSNHLTSLPSEIKQLSHLQTLYVSNNHLTSLPPEIGQLFNLQELYVDNNNLTSLPSEIKQLVNLQELHVDYNNLTSLPPEIGQLVNLQELYVDHNNLTSLPSEIDQLVNLDTLYFKNNNLTSFLPEICQLVNLLTLIASNNHITFLPPEIGQLVNLTELDVSSNHITSLPPEIDRLNLLLQLDLSNNPAIANTQTEHNQTMSAWHLSPAGRVIESFREANPNCEITL